ncbi:hypothetical protein ACMYR3_10940 [Ampullimonas aquatilis]|uniref:hypothetical protein n=1 Tax=Ampullimonas aquatilis TaxID=1341549 RepID=UPI003C7279B7
MNKQFFYLTNNQLTVYQEQQGLLAIDDQFANDSHGWQAFAEYVQNHKTIRTSILTDLIEEDFQCDLLPHVFGKVKQTLKQRRLTQLYRDTPYHLALQQGRAIDGRKDDKVLFSALTNPSLLTPWLDAIAQNDIPLVGIYSSAHLSERLIGACHFEHEHLLLVTCQSSGIRQSYFQNGRLKFSRLTPSTEQRQETIAEAVLNETAKTQQFLTNTRLLPRSSVVHTVLIGTAADIKLLISSRVDTVPLEHEYIDINHIFSRLSDRQYHPIRAEHVEEIFLALLARKSLQANYAPAEQTHRYRLWRVNFSLYASSTLILLAALLWSGLNTLDIYQEQNQLEQLMQQNNIAEMKLQLAKSALPPTPVNSQTLKASVEIADMLASNHPDLDYLIGHLSQVLDRMPQIRLDRLQWKANNTIDDHTGDTAVSTQEPTTDGLEPRPAAIHIGVPQKVTQTLLIEGEIVPYQRNYRFAVESLRQFGDLLTRNKNIAIEVIRNPFDTRSSTTLEGLMSNEESDIKGAFSLKLIWHP